MKKYYFLTFILLFICIILTGCDTNSYMKEVSYNEYLNLKEDSKKNNEKFILYIKQDNCKHCKNFTPTIAKVAKEYKVTIYYINLTKLTEAEYNKFKEEGTFSGTPTVLFYENGEELGSFSRLVGNKSEKTLINRLTARGYINE